MPSLNSVKGIADHRCGRFSAVGRSILSGQDWQRVGGALGLSRRELELVQHIFDGKKLSAVAQAMRLSLGTVKTYSQRIRQKLAVSDQRELTLAVLSTHLRLGTSED